MSGYSKPLFEAEKQLQYQKHLHRLSQISNQRSKKVIKRDTIEEMHRIRNKSMQFHTQKHLDILSFENQKIINRLIGITKKKSTSFINYDYEEIPKIKSFNNPARKRQRKQREAYNLALAERILSKQSDFDVNTRKKSIEEYEQIKKQMQHNKMLPIPDLTRSRSHQNNRQRTQLYNKQN